MEIALFLLIVLVVALTGSAIALDRRGLRLDIDAKNLRLGVREVARQPPPEPGSTEKRLAFASARRADLTVALLALIDADDAQLEATGTHYFTNVCDQLRTVLAAGGTTYIRVALWTVDEAEPMYLRRLASAGYDHNDHGPVRLDQRKHWAGVAITQKANILVPDVGAALPFHKDPPPTFKSMVAVVIGQADSPWAVVTADADAVGAFSLDAERLITDFGGLITVAAKIIKSRDTKRLAPVASGGATVGSDAPALGAAAAPRV